MRAEAVRAVTYLYYEDADPAVESVLTSQYWNEVDDEVRLAIVNGLCEDRFFSQATRDVLEDALNSYDEDIVTRARSCTTP